MPKSFHSAETYKKLDYFFKKCVQIEKLSLRSPHACCVCSVESNTIYDTKFDIKANVRVFPRSLQTSDYYLYNRFNLNDEAITIEDIDVVFQEATEFLGKGTYDLEREMLEKQIADTQARITEIANL